MKKQEPVVCPHCKKVLVPTKYWKYPPHREATSAHICPRSSQRIPR